MLNFKIEKELDNGLGRVGEIHTPHGVIETPAFIVVGTKATIKALPVENVVRAGAQSILANTYHLYLQPGMDIIKKAGGFPKFMNYNGPTFTDSGGFQVFSLGTAFGSKVSKVAKEKTKEREEKREKENPNAKKQLAYIDEDGVNFRSHINGSLHRFTPESSMQIQWDLGADIIFAFDECTSPTDSHAYQKQALDRTHRWAQRSLDAHNGLDKENVQSLFGVVQGGTFEDLRRESARHLGNMSFDGYGIGGSFTKSDMGTAVRWVNEELPKEKPRHLLGIGEPIDLFLGAEFGCDTFDCVTPTRLARHGHIYTRKGVINLKNSQYKTDFSALDSETPSYPSQNHSRAYLAHLFRANEMLAATLASEHNIYFIVNLVKEIRQGMLDGTFYEFKEEFLKKFYSK